MIKTIRNHIETPFTCDQVFDLVADVEKYPQFLPYCESLEVRGRKASPDGEIVLADMMVGYGPVRQSYTSRVLLKRNVHRIEVEAINGPFKVLTNHWAFKGMDQGCRIEFELAYEFASRSLQVLAGNLAEKGFERYVDAFMTRAKKVYGG